MCCSYMGCVALLLALHKYLLTAVHKKEIILYICALTGSCNAVLMQPQIAVEHVTEHATDMCHAPVMYPSVYCKEVSKATTSLCHAPLCCIFSQVQDNSRAWQALVCRPFEDG